MNCKPSKSFINCCFGFNPFTISTYYFTLLVKHNVVFCKEKRQLLGGSNGDSPEIHLPQRILPYHNCFKHKQPLANIDFTSSNPRVPCRAGIIPSLDLTKWAEFPSAPHYVSNYAEDYVSLLKK